MIERSKVWVEIFFIVAISVLGIGINRAQAGVVKSILPTDQELIKVTVHDYFEMRYRYLSIPQLEDISTYFEVENYWGFNNLLETLY